MSFDLNAHLDWSKFGISSASDASNYPSSADVSDAAVAVMQADSWSNDLYAISSVEHRTKMLVNGNKDALLFDPRTEMLIRNADDALVYGNQSGKTTTVRCSALADSYDTSAHSGETALTIRVFCVNSSANSFYINLTFKTTSSETPDNAWSWVSSGALSAWCPASYNDYLTFSPVITLDNWLWVITSFYSYDIEPSVPSPPGENANLFGVSNTIRIN